MGGSEQGVPSKLSSTLDLASIENHLSRVHAVVALLVFGSVARGEDDDRSDADVMIVVQGRGSAVTLDRAIRADRELQIVPAVRTVASLFWEVGERPSFIAHLVDEAVMVRSWPAWPSVRNQLALASTDPEALEVEVKGRLRHLQSFLRPERFRLSPVTALSHLWAISRSVVIARLVQHGVHEYSWQRVFDRYADVRPDLRGDLEALKELRPYYEYARARPGSRMPEASVDTDELRRLVEAVEQVSR